MADAFEQALDAERLLQNNTAAPLRLFLQQASDSQQVQSVSPLASSASTTVTTTPSSIATVRPAKTRPQFSGQYFNCQQYGHCVAECQDKKNNILIGEVDDEEILGTKTTACTLIDEVHNDVEFSYGDDHYNLVLTPTISSMEVHGELQQIGRE